MVSLPRLRHCSIHPHVSLALVHVKQQVCHRDQALRDIIAHAPRGLRAALDGVEGPLQNESSRILVRHVRAAMVASVSGLSLFSDTLVVSVASGRAVGAPLRCPPLGDWSGRSTLRARRSRRGGRSTSLSAAARTSPAALSLRLLHGQRALCTERETSNALATKVRRRGVHRTNP